MEESKAERGTESFPWHPNIKEFVCDTTCMSCVMQRHLVHWRQHVCSLSGCGTLAKRPGTQRQDMRVVMRTKGEYSFARAFQSQVKHNYPRWLLKGKLRAV